MFLASRLLFGFFACLLFVDAWLLAAFGHHPVAAFACCTSKGTNKGAVQKRGDSHVKGFDRAPFLQDSESSLEIVPQLASI